jgi:hypothetical protein
LGDKEEEKEEKIERQIDSTDFHLFLVSNKRLIEFDLVSRVVEEK